MKTHLIIASLIINLLTCSAQFGPSTNTYFSVAGSTPATGFFVFNIPGVTNYNVPASNMLAFLNVVATTPLATKQDVTNTVNVIGGGVVSNAINLTFNAGTAYTNDTIYYANVEAMIDLIGVGSGQGVVMAFLVDTNQDGTWDWSPINTSFTTDGSVAWAETLGATIPPGAAFRYDNQSTGGGSAAVQVTTGRIVYLK